MPEINNFFTAAIAHGGSDIHLLEGQKPKTRSHGHLAELDFPVLTRETMTAYLSEICPTGDWERYQKNHDLDFAYAMGEASRFRANYYYHMGGMGAVFRTIPTKIKTMEDLHLPPVMKKFALLRSGLVLVTGPTGSGKSTTLAAIIDHLNTHSARHILTIEEPVEFVHPRKKSILCQREVGRDTRSFADGLRLATRQDCDVVLVGEMRDLETIALAMTAAAMGSLVFGTLHTNSASKTIDRIISVFPTAQQGQARTMLADSLKGVVSQTLLVNKDGKGRTAAHEILLATTGLAASIREGNLGNIRNTIMTGQKDGMQLMDDCIDRHLKKGTISQEEALLKCIDKRRFLSATALA